MRAPRLSKAIWPTGKKSVVRCATRNRKRSCISRPTRSWASRCRIRRNIFATTSANGVNLLDAMVANRREPLRFLLDLRHLRTARARADRRNLAATADQSVRRIEAGLRENPALVRRDSRAAFCLAPLFQRGRRVRKFRRRPSARDASHSECPEGRARSRSRTSRFTAPITTRRMAPAFAITFTFSICRARTFSRSKRRRALFTISAPAAARACAK